MNLLLDTHVLGWVALGSDRLRKIPWVRRYRPWWVSPLSLLELQLLKESGRVDVDVRPFMEELASDERFFLDDLPLVALVRHALDLGWTRDPFDRLLAAHSRARQVPLCTMDRTIRRHHTLLPKELRD